MGSAILGEWLWWIYVVVFSYLFPAPAATMTCRSSDPYVCVLQTVEHTHLAHVTWPLIFYSRGRAETGRLEQAAGKVEEA
jgi:hypothetical protein